MADLTATQLSDIRFDLADVSSAFGSDELQRLWARTDDISNTARRLEVVKGLAIRALLHDAAKFNDWTAGETSEKKSQVFDHWKKVYDQFYASAVDAWLGTRKQFVWAGMRGHPHQDRTEPSDA